MGLYDRDWYHDLHRERAEESSRKQAAPLSMRPPKQLTTTCESTNKAAATIPLPRADSPVERDGTEACPYCGNFRPKDEIICVKCGHTDWGLLLFGTGAAAASLFGAGYGYLNLPGTVWPHLVGWGVGFIGLSFLCVAAGHWIVVFSRKTNDACSALNIAKPNHKHS